MKALLTSLALLSLAAPAPAGESAARVLALVRDGRPVEAARLDESVPAWSRAELDEVLDGVHDLIVCDDPAARAAAARLRGDLLGFAARVSPSRVSSGGSLEAVQAALDVADAAVHLVTELGDARDMVHGARHAANLFSLQRARRAPRDLVVRMVAETMEGDPRAVAGLRTAYRAAEPTVARALIDGLVGRGVAGDAAIAAQLLGEQPRADAYLLTRLMLVLREDGEALDDFDLGRVRAYLNHDEPGCRAGAARVAGRTVDFEAAAPLLDLLGDDSATVTSAAHKALQDITDLRFGPSAQRWRLWYQREMHWWEHRGETLVETLPELGQAQRITALNELASHPLQRRQIAPAVEPYLEDVDTRTVMMALSVLESARARASVPRIEPLLAHPSEDVKLLASKVLSSLNRLR
ncbi:MAG: hypothetical protein VX460_10530 [Planctomycetota bacterium]|nr:hypothetical protein [Planctomycetota bacterium]